MAITAITAVIARATSNGQICVSFACVILLKCVLSAFARIVFSEKQDQSLANEGSIMHISRGLWANSLKGGDAKPPV
jgi:hypothetical protein